MLEWAFPFDRTISNSNNVFEDFRREEEKSSINNISNTWLWISLSLSEEWTTDICEKNSVMFENFSLMTLFHILFRIVVYTDSKHWCCHSNNKIWINLAKYQILKHEMWYLVSFTHHMSSIYHIFSKWIDRRYMNIPMRSKTIQPSSQPKKYCCFYYKFQC